MSVQDSCPTDSSRKSCTSFCLSLLVGICSLWKGGLRFRSKLNLPSGRTVKCPSTALGMVRSCPPKNADAWAGACVCRKVTGRHVLSVPTPCKAALDAQGGRQGGDGACGCSPNHSWTRWGCGFCLSVFLALKQSVWYITAESIQWVWDWNPRIHFYYCCISFGWPCGKRGRTVKITLSVSLMHFLHITKVLMIHAFFFDVTGSFSFLK